MRRGRFDEIARLPYFFHTHIFCGLRSNGVEDVSLGDLSDEIEELARAAQTPPASEAPEEVTPRPDSLSEANWTEATRAQQ